MPTNAPDPGYQIVDTASLEDVLMRLGDTIVVRTALPTRLLIISFTTDDDGAPGYQGFPEAQDEDGNEVDAMSGYTDDLPASSWPLTYLAQEFPPRPPEHPVVAEPGEFGDEDPVAYAAWVETMRNLNHEKGGQ